MSFTCHYCGTWLSWSPEGTLVHEDGSKHLCQKAPWVLVRQGRVRARAAKKEQIERVDDYMLLADIHDQIRIWNDRLLYFELDLHVNPKQDRSFRR